MEAMVCVDRDDGRNGHSTTHGDTGNCRPELHYTPTSGFKRYYPTLRSFCKARTEKIQTAVLPIDHVGIVSYVTSSWITDILWNIYRSGSKVAISYTCPPMEACNPNTERFHHLWEEELKSQGPDKASFARVVDRFMRTRLGLTLAVFSLCLSLGFLTPSIFIFHLLEFIKNPEAPLSQGIFYIIAILLVDSIRVIVSNFIWSLFGRTSIRLRSGGLGIIQNKILSLHSLEGMSSGEIINLFANDGARLYEYAFCGYLWIPGSVVTLITMSFVIWAFGVPALAAITVFVIFYGIQYIFARLTAYYRRKAVKESDQRVRQMTEVLNSIKVIKLCAWEKPFTRAITDIRNRERKFLEKKIFCTSVLSSLSSSIPTVAAIATFLTCMLMGYELNSSKVYPSLGAIILARGGLLLLRVSAAKWAEFKSAAPRLQKVLLMTSAVSKPSMPKDPGVAICLEKASFAWEDVKASCKNHHSSVHNPKNGLQNRTVSMNSEEEALLSQHTLWDVTVSVKKGQLIGVCGTVGSGKSSLISAILGQMHKLEGSVAISGAIAYVAQQPWIMNGTVKENIIFGNSFDEDFFQRTIYSCGLEKDIDDMVSGIENEIGERGSNLSGGQKQRISLSRAVYSKRDIYLLDDPLSAVDQHVGCHIFHHCIKGMLSSKTVIFVTHQMQYLQECDHILVMKDGRIVQQGDPTSLGNHEGEYSMFLKTFNHGQQEYGPQKKLIQDNMCMPGALCPSHNLNGSTNKEVQSKVPVTNKKQIVVEQANRISTITLETYKEYVKALGGVWMALTMFFLVGLTISASTFSNWWLSRMLSASEAHSTKGMFNATTSNDGTPTNYHVTYDNMNILIYGLFLVAIFVTATIKSFVYVKGTLQATTVLQKSAFRNVIYSPMHLFDTVPIGRIINVFSKDQDEVDSMLPTILEEAMVTTWLTIVSLIMVVIVFPWFLIPLGLMTGFFLMFTVVFHVAQRELKRLENISRSPFFGHIEAMVQGLATIHAFNREKDFHKTFMELQDTNSSIQLLMWSSHRWIAFRLDLLTVLVTTVTATFVVFTRGMIPAAFAGLTLTFSSQLGGVIHYLVRNMAEVEARFTNVERITHFSKNLKHEGADVQSPMDIPSDWPSAGEVIFEDIEMRYGEGLPLALSAVSFKVEAGQKIGIVGRTGSGKSSLGAVLFRLIDPGHGRIFIDGIDTSRLRLEDLRSRLSMIPQDPVLFMGTVRYNLDPLDQFPDDDIWRVLARTHLKDKISGLEEQLLAPVVENGENFSVGERQLLCLARALLRRSKIIVLDEATASVDTRTDALVQEILKDAFADCTILTIAHRINTVVNYDKIMVLDDGKVVEFNSASRLRNDPSSLFHKLWKESSAIEGN